MRIGIAADHGGFAMKSEIVARLSAAKHEIKDFGAMTYNAEDDYPDFVVPLARAVAAGEVARGIAFCGSGVGACVAANKIAGARAASVTDVFSAHQGVEDDDMNIICLGGRTLGGSLAWELARAFLEARFTGAERHQRRLSKVAQLEKPADPESTRQVCERVCRGLRKEGVAEDIVRRVERQITYGGGN